MNAAIPERRPATEEISRSDRARHLPNDESGFCVLRMKARGQREETTVRVSYEDGLQSQAPQVVFVVLIASLFVQGKTSSARDEMQLHSPSSRWNRVFKLEPSL